MSRLIGHVRVAGTSDGKGGGVIQAAHHVAASVAGVELESDPKSTLEPHEARVYVALIEIAIEEAEVMRSQAMARTRQRGNEGALKLLLKSLTAEQISALNELFTRDQVALFSAMLETVEKDA